VHSGGQGVVGMVGAPGGGGNPKLEDQPHAKQIAYAPQPPMRSADKAREPVPVARDAERPVPPARRKVAGRSQKGTRTRSSSERPNDAHRTTDFALPDRSSANRGVPLDIYQRFAAAAVHSAHILGDGGTVGSRLICWSLSSSSIGTRNISKASTTSPGIKASNAPIVNTSTSLIMDLDAERFTDRSVNPQ
jgi:hypothetical protein